MRVSVVIPNRNDTVMLGVTVRVALEQLVGVDGGGEVIVVDNSDADIYRVIKTRDDSPLPLAEPNLTLIRQDFPSMHPARETGFEAAKGEYLILCDSHTILGHNLINDCVNFMDKTPQCGLGYSPIGWVDKPRSMSPMTLTYNKDGGIFGPWGREKHNVPFKIPWHFGFKVTRRDWFLNVLGGYGFFTRERLSWGGSEFYTAMKTWMLGYECWSIPCSPCYHIKYSGAVEKIGNYHFRTYGSSGVGRQGIGILSAFYALGGEEYGREDAVRNRKAFEQYGLDLDRDWEEAKSYVGTDREWLDQHAKTSYKDVLEGKPWDEGRAVRDN